MDPRKPLYPPPWWRPCCPTDPVNACDELFPPEDLLVRYVGTDCEGNALYCVKRRRRPCMPPTPIQPRLNR